MKNHIIKFSVFLFIIFLSACKTEKSNTIEDNTSNEVNLYLGQKLPGLTPEPFAPGLVTTEGWEYSGTFSPDLKEFYFLREVEGTKEQEFVVYKSEGDIWSEIVISS